MGRSHFFLDLLEWAPFDNSGVVQLAAHQTLDLVILVRVQAPEPSLQVAIAKFAASLRQRTRLAGSSSSYTGVFLRGS